MKDLDLTQKLSVLHCVYQLIASADGGIDPERDEKAIELALEKVGLNANHYWQTAIAQNPYDCFFHIAMLSAERKEEIKELFNQITTMGGNPESRVICATHLGNFCRFSE